MTVEKVTRRCLLGVFAHPDDETSGCAGTLTRYARDGVDVYVVTATRGELGGLGTGDLTIKREDLPAVRESELRAVLKLYGAYPPILLDYRDQEVAQADFETLTQQLVTVMEQLRPDVLITFGPTGISDHPDHKAIHRTAVEAFQRYRQSAESEPRLYYVALPEVIATSYGFALDPAELDISVCIDITEVKPFKIQGLRLYRSQQDAQDLATEFEAGEFDMEWFHQAYPPVLKSAETVSDFWPG